MSESTDWVTALATVGATVISIASVYVAAKSASASQASAEVAARVLHRSAVRELVSGCYELIAEELRIRSLVTELRSEYSSLGVVTGSSGGSREKMYKDLLQKDLATAEEKIKEAKSLVEDQAKLFAASDNDIDLMQGRIQAANVDLKTIREAMSRQLDNLRTQVQNLLGKGSQ